MGGYYEFLRLIKEIEKQKKLLEKERKEYSEFLHRRYEELLDEHKKNYICLNCLMPKKDNCKCEEGERIW